ncbi:hypothetical protein FisN_2Hh537 [Fistulifera solaris]|jgi:hypothetical protein|uniref:Uncharacterized protein n=1 Tax=Fistulifera solaris TaxID=1519565 RepID=A0A1Z5JI89_FISSO|nr:hypothetical protein FisN_2Hh537 [Fistulifera solaris]|eukprot:GAX13717.1 hypothetical protein FisN_2Hh537 [Fistulifera solaris]
MSLLNDSLAAEIARLEAEVERKRLQQQIQAMENEIAQEMVDNNDDDEEELIVLTAPKSNWKNVSDQSFSASNEMRSPRSVQSGTTIKSPLSTPGKSPVRRSLFLKSVVQAASERSEQSERNVTEAHQYQTETEAETVEKNLVSPNWKNKSPVRRSVFLQSVVAASELRASATHDTSSSSHLSENDPIAENRVNAQRSDVINLQQQRGHDGETTHRSEDEGLDCQQLEAEIRALEESAARTKRAIEEELEKRRRQEEGTWQVDEDEYNYLQNGADHQAQHAPNREEAESYHTIAAVEKVREAATGHLKLNVHRATAEPDTTANYTTKKKSKAELQRAQLEEEIRRVEAAAAETLRKKNEALERQRLEDEAREAEIAVEQARQKRDEELFNHPNSVDENGDIDLNQPRPGAFFEDVEDEASRALAETTKKLEQERLQAEIREMELELRKRRAAASSGASVTSKSSLSSKTSKKGKQRKVVSKKSLERQKLEEEIARMEAEIGNATSNKAHVNSPLAEIVEAGASLEVPKDILSDAVNENQDDWTSMMRPMSNDGPPARPAFLAGIAGAAAAVEQRSNIENVSKPMSNKVAPARPAFSSGIAEAAAAREERTQTAEDTTELETISNSVRSACPAFLSGIAGAARARDNRVAEDETAITTDGILSARPSTETESSPKVSAMPMRPNLLAAISGAATERQERLEATGGELQMREVVPEVEDSRQNTPQPSFALAEMVSKKAKDREKRLEAGGEKRMTKIKEKAEYKSVFSNVAIEAANMGRLTRLNEHTVEAVAQEKTPQQEWKSKGLLAIDWRSTHMAIIHQAAARGNETKMREYVVSNKSVEEEEEWEAKEVDRNVSRLNQLLELNKKVGTGTAKVDELVMGLREENQSGESMLIRPMYAYNNIEEVKLPKPLPPSIDVNKAKQKAAKLEEEAARQHRQHLPMANISAHVAEVVWERRARLNRPGSMPKVRQACDCPYCGTASPYQTFAYREAEKRHKDEMKHRKERQQHIEEELAANPIKNTTIDTVKESAHEAPLTPVAVASSAGDKLRKKLEAKKAPNLPASKPSPAPKNATAKPPVAASAATSASSTTTRVGNPPKAQQPEPLAANQGCACVIL